MSTHLDPQIAQMEHAGRWDQVVALLQQRVNLVADPAEKARTLERMMRVYHERFGNVVFAIQTAEHILRIAPAHPSAITYLEAAYTNRREHAKLQALQQHKASLAARGQSAQGGGVFGQVGAAIGGAVSGAMNTAVAYSEQQAAEQAREAAEAARRGAAAAARCAYCRTELRGARQCPGCGATSG